MKLTLKNILLTSITVIFVSCGQSILSTRETTDFNSDWQFSMDNKSWENIHLPHTARIEPLVVNDQWQGDCWYKKEFTPTVADSEKLFLYFEGVMHETEVWVNDQKVTSHQGGYTPFTADITNFVKSGQKNSIAVKVNNQDNPQIQPGKPLKTLDFNYYGGIYRNVHLIKTNKLFITDAVHANTTAGGGIFIHFDEITKEKATGKIQVQVKNEFATTEKVALEYLFTDNNGESIKINSAEFEIAPNSDTTFSDVVTIEKPQLWDTETPNLYKVNVKVISKKAVVDEMNTTTGIRKIELKPDGFYLNDKKTFINGTNRHQEYPYIGYALSDEAQYRDAVKIKNAGFNFVRLSHYPHSESFMQACDELGLFVMDCISGWQFFGDEKFVANSLKEVKDMARRDRNHPSIIFWEVSLNESEMNEAYMKEANAVLRKELLFKNSYTAGWIDNPNYDIYIPARQHGKAPEYWNNYEKENRKILIAEYGDWEYYAQNAGFNQTAFANLKEEERTSRQLRNTGEKRLLQQAFNFQEAFNSNIKGKHTIGQANWLMFDYNRGYSDDLESSGISDIFRINKFSHDFYKSQQSPQLQSFKGLELGPMVSIASYWTEKSPLNLKVFSNCDEVALYLNNLLIAKQKPLRDAFSSHLPHPPFVFSLPNFEKGTLRAEAFIDGKKVAEHSVTTPEKPVKLQLQYDLSTKAISKTGKDVIFVYAKVVDQNGTIIPDATNPVTFTIDGKECKLIGENPVKADAGIATILLETYKLNTTIKITAKASNLETATIEIK